MATHFTILAWRIPWKEEPPRPTVHGVVKSQDRTEQLTLSLLVGYSQIQENLCEPRNHPLDFYKHVTKCILLNVIKSKLDPLVYGRKITFLSLLPDKHLFALTPLSTIEENQSFEMWG